MEDAVGGDEDAAEDGEQAKAAAARKECREDAGEKDKDADRSGSGGHEREGGEAAVGLEKKKGPAKGRKKGEANILVENLPPGFLKVDIEKTGVSSPAQQGGAGSDEDEDDEEMNKPTLRSRVKGVVDAAEAVSEGGDAGAPSAAGKKEEGGSKVSGAGKGRGKGGNKDAGAPAKGNKGKKGGRGKASVVRGASPPGEEVECGHEDWLRQGWFVEVNWDSDWWQATAKRIKAQGGAIGVAKGHVLVSYVGGTAEDDEWIEIARCVLRLVRSGAMIRMRWLGRENAEIGGPRFSCRQERSQI